MQAYLDANEEARRATDVTAREFLSRHGVPFTAVDTDATPVTAEATLALVRERLRPGGIVALNVAAVPDDKRLVRAIGTTLAAELPQRTEPAGTVERHAEPEQESADDQATPLDAGAGIDRARQIETAALGEANEVLEVAFPIAEMAQHGVRSHSEDEARLQLQWFHRQSDHHGAAPATETRHGLLDDRVGADEIDCHVETEVSGKAVDLAAHVLR